MGYGLELHLGAKTAFQIKLYKYGWGWVFQNEHE